MFLNHHERCIDLGMTGSYFTQLLFSGLKCLYVHHYPLQNVVNIYICQASKSVVSAVFSSNQSIEPNTCKVVPLR